MSSELIVDSWCGVCIINLIINSTMDNKKKEAYLIRTNKHASECKKKFTVVYLRWF